MAGHSQFKNIMHRKGRQDKVRSKLFSKLAREITTAAKLGLPDPSMNARLRAAIIAAAEPGCSASRRIADASGRMCGRWSARCAARRTPSRNRFRGIRTNAMCRMRCARHDTQPRDRCTYQPQYS